MIIGVTGAAGFVGSQIVRTCLEAFPEAHILAIDNLSKGKLGHLAEPLKTTRVDFIEAEASEARDLRVCDAIVHAAAYPDIKSNWKNEHERVQQWVQNAVVTRDVVELAKPGASFVMISTCSVYGSGRGITEETTPRATSPYAASKLAAEAWVTSFAAAGRIKLSTLRLVNVVGPRYGHGHLADFVKMAQAGHLHALDDGAKKKSFVHVADVAGTVAAVLKAIDTRPIPLVNVTSPYVWSWRDSVAVMRAMHPERDFRLTWEERPSGWVGDADELEVDSVVVPKANRHSIVDGVHAALVGLGWSKPEAPEAERLR